MKAKETNLPKFLNAPKQFIIPVYQRTYSWKRQQCVKLWDDIVRIGSVVYIEKGIYNVTAVPELLVIDGQQRLTTIILMVAALAKVVKEQELDIGISSKKLRNYFLFNSDEEGDLRYKLVLTKGDNPTLKKVLKDLDPGESPSPRLLDNYRLFYERMASGKYNLNSLYQGVQKLIIVDIALDRSHDNPQLIFESLNSTGLDLSQADLIRNYVLMGEESKEQTRLYEDYWRPMEIRFGYDHASLFDSFMRDYLTLKTGDIPKFSEVYEDFKKYVRKQGEDLSIEDLLKEINTYSGYYVKFALLKETDSELLEVFQDIKTLKVDVSYPFILEAYIDYIEGVLLKKEFIQILRLVESYVFRRAICGIPTNSLNKTFQTFSKDIVKTDYLDSVKAAFINKGTYRRFPTNSELEQELKVRDVYNFRSRGYLLDKLENFDRKEHVKIDEYTIEHIMPQNKNLSSEWKQELGSSWELVKEKFLHTIGNLTLTGYNPELSDRPFKAKRDMKGGFRDSPIRLNRSLATKETWNENAILERSEELATKIALLWNYPDLSEEKLALYQKSDEAKVEQEYTLEDHTYLQGESLLLFEQLRERILDLDSSVYESVKKFYIAFKNSTNFVDIVPYKSELGLVMNMDYDQIDDPRQLCRDPEDLNIFAGETDNILKIGCIFNELPAEVVVDEKFPTSFGSEYLTNREGDLEIIKEYKVNKTVGKPTVYINASHPTIDKIEELHALKIRDLQKLGKKLGVDGNVSDERASSLWRKAIWDHYDDLQLAERLIDVSQFGKDAKSINDKINSLMPIYALFKSDRPSNDSDPEAKDPMQAAVKMALKEYESQINSIQDDIIEKVEDVANRTLEKLHEMNEELAKDLKPKFKKEPKWSFDFTIDSDDGVPLNKRGSGVRRLILLNFFRAEAEKEQTTTGKSNVIYAIEEPETSQHPDYQIMLMEALMNLSKNSNCQILLTTHVPALAGLLPTDSIRFISTAESDVHIEYGSEDVLKVVAENIGVLPEKEIAGAKAIVMVEGPSDITFLKHASKVLHEKGMVPFTLIDRGIVPVITGGCNNLKHWITKKTADEIGLEWAVFMDSDIGHEHEYSKSLAMAEEIKKLGKFVHLTRKREPENYIHPRLLNEYDIEDFEQTDEGDSKLEISRLAPINKGKVLEILWPKMTADQILEMDQYEEEGVTKHELVGVLNNLLKLVPQADHLAS